MILRMQGNVFKKIGNNLGFRPLLKAIEDQPHLWLEITDRQKYATNQKDTESIFLRWCESKTIDAAFNEIPAVDYPALEKLPEVRPLLAYISDLTNARKLGRVLITNLKAGGFIDKHIDEGTYPAHHSRIHLPLQSDDGNLFFCEESEGCGEFVHMKPGEIWWFNNKKPHWVMNDSGKDRIHLIVDVVSNDFEVQLEIPA